MNQLTKFSRLHHVETHVIVVFHSRDHESASSAAVKECGEVSGTA